VTRKRPIKGERRDRRNSITSNEKQEQAIGLRMVVESLKRNTNFLIPNRG
jgi:hypothetical protein